MKTTIGCVNRLSILCQLTRP